MANINGVRVGVLGTSVDDPADDSNPNWTTTGPLAFRNSLNTDERIPTRAINALAEDLDLVDQVTTSFDHRLTRVVGDDAAADQTAFNAIGKNLIQAVHDLTSAGAAMPEPPDDDKLYG